MITSVTTINSAAFIGSSKALLGLHDGCYRALGPPALLRTAEIVGHYMQRYLRTIQVKK